jgi:Dinitrogenase reductase ADP-ribosyltransferase (DRAT).
MEPTPHPLGHSTNLVGLPTGLLGSVAFNDFPPDIHIVNVRETNPQLFEMLARSDGLADAGDAFYKYMVAVFGADPEQHDAEDEGRGRRGWARPYRSSFLRLLIGWGYDASGPEGAVLKGWVESRFGLFPTFHKEVIASFDGPAWEAYEEERMAAAFHGNAIHSQLDLLYEYCQWALATHVAPGQRHLTLYRGVNFFEEHQIVERIDRRTAVMRLNNLGSFTRDPEVADCFGDTVLTVRVPVAKIAFFNTLLPFYPLKGEGEFLVIGGDYLVHTNRG